MKVKVFSTLAPESLEKKVNAFLEQSHIKVHQIQFQASFGAVYAMVTYDEQEPAFIEDGFKNI